MERVTIGKLRNQFSAYLRKVRAGETVIVCDRDTPVARLTPISETDDEQALAQLAAKGVLRPPAEPWRPDRLACDPPESQKSIVQTLLEEREEGR